jgi:molybdopterin synthase catalytic subunit
VAETRAIATITDQPIDLNELVSAVQRASNGAVVLFVGTVRDVNEGRQVTGIRYDAYREMAEGVLGEIIAEAAGKAGVAAIEATHRVGELNIGDASVAIAVSTPHRAQAFEACRYIIEQIKVRLPIWKHEQYADGETQWVRGVDPATGNVIRP